MPNVVRAMFCHRGVGGEPGEAQPNRGAVYLVIWCHGDATIACFH